MALSILNWFDAVNDLHKFSDMIWFFECVLKSVIYFKLRLHELVSMYIASCAFTFVWFMNIFIDIEVRLHEIMRIVQMFKTLDTYFDICIGCFCNHMIHDYPNEDWGKSCYVLILKCVRYQDCFNIHTILFHSLDYNTFISITNPFYRNDNISLTTLIYHGVQFLIWMTEWKQKWFDLTGKKNITDAYT